MDTLQEQRLIQRARKRDQQAFEELIHLYEKRVFALTRRMCRNEEDAAEAAQEAFFAAWQALPDFRGSSSFSTWLYRLASNACIDLLRREGRHKAAAGASFDDEEAHLEICDSTPTPQEHIEQQELRHEIESALQQISPEYRQALILREIHQLSYDEISAALKLDPGTVKSRISRGRRRLREILLQSGNFYRSAPSNHTEKEGCK